MLWYCRTRAPGSVAKAAVIGDGSAKWKIVTSPRARAASSANGRTSSRRSSSIGQREQVGGVALGPQQIADAPGAVADGVAPVGGRHPLVDRSWRRRGGLALCGVDRRAGRRRRPGGTGAAPRAAGCRRSDPRSRRRRAAPAAAASPAPARRSRGPGRRSRGPAAAPAPRPGRRRSAPRDRDRSTTASTIAATCAGILVGVEHAAAVHRRRNRRRGVGDDRQADVERLHQRHAEALVLAGAEEQVGDLVAGGELGVRDVAEEVDVVRAEVRDQLLQHREVALEARRRADQQQPRPRVVARLVGVEVAG